MGQGKIDLLEKVFRAAIEEAGLPDVCVALHNACCHGETFACTEKGLKALFVHLDGLNKVARKIEEM